MKRAFLVAISILMTIGAFASTSVLRATRGDNYDSPSSSWKYGDSNLHHYNSIGMDTLIGLYLYSQNTWKLRANYSLTYNNMNNLTDYTMGIVDTGTGQVNRYVLKYMYDYNAAGDTTMLLIQQWDTNSNNWLNYVRLYRYPDASHHDTSALMQRYNSGAWHNSQYMQYNYNASGQLINSILGAWNGGNVYSPLKKIRFSYDANGNVLSMTYQLWDNSASAWENDTRHTFTWNSSNDNTQRQFTVWDPGTSTWTNDSMVSQTFDGAHHVINQLTQHYDNGTSAYVNYKQSNYVYDGSGNVTSRENDDWVNSQWRHYERYTDQYNGNNQVIFELHEYYKTLISMYEPYEREYYYYDDVNTGVGVVSEGISMVLYPNPAPGDLVYISFDQVAAGDMMIAIYDLQGRMISQETRPDVSGAKPQPIDISALSAGQYLVSITTADGKRFASKMTKP